MLKRKSNIIAAMIIGLSLGVTGAAKAALLSDVPPADTPEVQQGMHKGCKAGGAVCKVLRDKLGINDTDIENAAKSGMTAFDLAKAKGYTPDQLKTMIIEERYASLDEEVKSGKITKENADTLKNDFKNKIQNWDGSLKHNKKFGRRHRGVYKILKTKLGYTDSEIEKAVKEGKSAFDLAGAKKVTPEQFKAMVIEEQSKYIDEAVAKGSITKEKGEGIKTDLKNYMQNWDGKLNYKADNKS